MHTNTHIHEHIWYWYTKCTLHAGCPRHEHREAGNALKTSYVLIDGARGAYECCRCCSPPSVSTRMMGIILHDQRCHTHIYMTPKLNECIWMYLLLSPTKPFLRQRCTRLQYTRLYIQYYSFSFCLFICGWILFSPCCPAYCIFCFVFIVRHVR